MTPARWRWLGMRQYFTRSSTREATQRLPDFRSQSSPGLQSQKVKSDILAALKVCISLRDLERGKRIHRDAVESGYQSDIFVATTLVDMYAKCRSMGDAHAVFDSMERRDVVAWNALILGYASNGEGELALRLFASMGSQGCTPNTRTFVAALMACSSVAEREEAKQVEGKSVKMGCLERGMSIHSEARKYGCDSHMFVANSLLGMYAKCGSLAHAQAVFDGMASRSVVTWTALMLGYVEQKQSEVALDLYERMQREGCMPDSRTYVAALMACSSLAGSKGKSKMAWLEKGIAIHSRAEKAGCHLDIFVATALVDMYAKCGSMGNARVVFDRMQRHDVVSWNALLLGYAENGEPELALQLFMGMGCAPDARTFVALLTACESLAIKETGQQVRGRLVKTECLQKIEDIHFQARSSGCDTQMFVANALMNAYAKCGSMEQAAGVFDRMIQKDVVSWTTLILGFAENREAELALQHLERMEIEGYSPNALTFVAALTACSCLGAVEAARALHARICRLGLETDAVIASSLLDFYGKTGSMQQAQQVFDTLVTDDDCALWNSLLSGYSRQGDTARVFRLLEQMHSVGLEENGITFLAILTACSHAGLVEKGRKYFRVMTSQQQHHVGIEHYHCMVDMLGRANRLDEALEVVKQMPFAADAVTWTIILGASHKWRNVKVGEAAFEALLRLDDKQATAYVLMANIYSSMGMWEEKRKVMAAMQRKVGMNIQSGLGRPEYLEQAEAQRLEDSVLVKILN